MCSRFAQTAKPKQIELEFNVKIPQDNFFYASLQYRAGAGNSRGANCKRQQRNFLSEMATHSGLGERCADGR